MTAKPEVVATVECEDCGETVALEADDDFGGLAYGWCACGTFYSDSWDGTFKWCAPPREARP